MPQLVYYPFKKSLSVVRTVHQSTGAISEVEPCRSWQKFGADQIFYQDSADLSPIAALEASTDVLYIVGQCTAGSSYLYSVDRTAQMDFRTLMGQLADIPLSGDFAGRIKVFACNSAMKSSNSISFTAQLASCMRNNGWEDAQFVGYTEQISMFATTQAHGNANMNNTTGQHKWGLATGSRAKFCRMDF